MEDFDGDVGRRHAVGGAFEHSVYIVADVLANVGRDIEDINVARCCKIALELGLVNLRNGPNAKGLFLKVFEYFIEVSTVEGSLYYSFCSVEGMRRSIGV